MNHIDIWYQFSSVDPRLQLSSLQKILQNYVKNSPNNKSQVSALDNDRQSLGFIKFFTSLLITKNHTQADTLLNTIDVIFEVMILNLKSVECQRNVPLIRDESSE